MIHHFLAKLRAAKARKAEAVRQAKLAPWKRALARRDTRLQNATWPTARQATCKALASEMGREWR